MGSRRVAFGLVLVTIAVGGAFACADSEPSDVPNYGPANGIDGKKPNAPGTSPNSSSGSGSGSGGGTTEDAGAPSGEGGVGPVAAFACEKSGGAVVDGGPCAVSWTTNIYPAMQPTGSWGCASAGACHSVTVPVMTGTPSAVYATLANYTTVNALPYFNPCSTDPTKSIFVCNTSTATCSVQMPIAGGTGVPGTIDDAGAAMIAAWVACGAPQN